jgi:hypothetical protein
MIIALFRFSSGIKQKVRLHGRIPAGSREKVRAQLRTRNK